MGAEGYLSQVIFNPCANCGKKHGYRGGSDWALEFGELVCSEACGIRLTKKRESGMVPRPIRYEQERIEHLRLCVTVLRGVLERRTKEFNREHS